MGGMRSLYLVLALLVAPLSSQAETLVGLVVAINDGDTLVLQVDRQRHTLRLSGIDAPERVQSFGNRSMANLGQWVFQKRAMAECAARGSEGVPRCKVLVDGVDIGLRQLADGMAWRLQSGDGAESPELGLAYQQAETMARLRRLGLWSETNPTPPWDWKKLRR